MNLRINILPDLLAVARLGAGEPVPAWMRGRFTSITRTAAELSIVCDDDAIPEDVQAERRWRAFEVVGPLPFEMTGVAAALVAPLADARISVFLIATFDTDYLLVRVDDFTRTVEVLRAAGHEVVGF